MNIHKFCKAVSVALVAILFSGCATIFKGTSQNISVNSTPSGADVFVDGQLKGKTPVSFTLKKNKSNVLEIKKVGYETVNQAFGKKYDPVALINIFWDLSTTDLISGAAFEYEPGSYNFKLEKAGAN